MLFTLLSAYVLQHPILQTIWTSFTVEPELKVIQSAIEVLHIGIKLTVILCTCSAHYVHKGVTLTLVFTVGAVGSGFVVYLRQMLSALSSADVIW